MSRALVSSQCWSCILKQSTGASRSSRSSRRSESSSRTIQPSVSGRCLYSSSSNSDSVSDGADFQSRDSKYKSYQDSFPSTTSSKLKGKQKQQLDQDEPDCQSSIPPSPSDWDLFSSDSFFNLQNHHPHPNPSSDPPISSSSPPSTQVSRQVLFSQNPQSSESTFYQNQFPSFSNQSQRAEILRRRRNEKERIGNHSNDMTSSGNGSRRSNQYRAPLTEPEADRFRKVFDLINDQDTVVEDDRRKLNGEIGNAIQLVEGLKGKGNGKLDLDFRNSSRFSKKDGNLKNEELDYPDRNLGGESQVEEEEIGHRFRSSDDDKEIKTKSVNETLDEILQNVRYPEGSKADQEKRGSRNQEASIGSHYLNPIAGNESLQGFRNRNRLNRFQNQIQRRRQSIDEEDREVHGKTLSGGSGLSIEEDVQEVTRRVEFEKNLAEIKDEIDSIMDLNQVWDWFSIRVLGTSKENVELDRDSSNPNQETSTPCGIQTPYFSPILIHLFQTFKTKFNSPESSITLYEIVKSHSVESLIMSSSIPFFNLVLKTFWLDFKDYRECLKVLEVAQMVGVLDLEKDPPLEREDDFDGRSGEDEQQKFGDESIRETVELIRNEIRQEVLSKIELNKRNSIKSQEHSIPFNSRAESNSTEETSDPDPSLGFPIPTSLFKSIKLESDFTSLESSEKLKVVHQMGLIVGKPFRVSSRISRDSSRSSTPSSRTTRFKSKELSQYEDEFREEKKKRLVEKLEERRLEKEQKKDLGRKKNLAKVKVRSHSSRFSEKEMDSNQGGRWEKDEDSYGGRW